MTIDHLIDKVEKLSKSKEALKTIGEVADILSIDPHVIRFWESKFQQIKPYKNKGIRYYTNQDIETLSEIKKFLYEEGYTIKGVQQLLSNARIKNPHMNITNQDLSECVLIERKEIEKMIEQFKSIRNKLKSLN